MKQKNNKNKPEPIKLKTLIKVKNRNKTDTPIVDNMTFTDENGNQLNYDEWFSKYIEQPLRKHFKIPKEQ